MSILDTLTRELDWREIEIASMRRLLVSSSLTPAQRTTLLRAAWAMLYAHYEGFCKNALIAFYDAISHCPIVRADLPTPTKILSLRSDLTRLRSLPDGDLLYEIESFSKVQLNGRPAFPEVDTKSNLWPDTLIELIVAADLSPSKVEGHRNKLNTLVSRRNEIAHGKDNIIAEFDYYKTYEDAVYEVIYDLAYQVASRLEAMPYTVST